MSFLEIHTTHLAYDDTSATSSPKLVHFDRTRNLSGIQVTNPESKRYELLPGEVKTIFSGVRSTSIAGDTAFGLSLNSANSGVYRLAYSAGTLPVFRTVRSFSPSGVSIVLSVNNNATLEMTIGSGNFNAQVGDTLFIPDAASGDSAGSFSALNGGYWVVLAATTTHLTLQRPVGEDFVGVSETVVPASNSELIIFSSTGVQPNDTLEISAGFSSVTQQAYTVTAVTPTWVEFLSSAPIPLETGIIPGAAGVTFYTDSKRFLRLEVDQDAAVRLNGDTGNTNRLAPRTPGDPLQMAQFEKWGPCWQLVVVNRSTTAKLTLNLVSGE